MTLPPEAPTGPWARVWGRVVVPDAEPRGPGGGTVTFDPDPDPVRVTLAPGKALVASRTVCKVDRDGYLVAPSGRQYVDLVAPGADVTPEGSWTYTMTLRLPNEPTRRVHVALTRGAVTALADLVPVAPSAGSPSQPPAPPSGDLSAQVAAARAAAEGARASADAAARDLAAVRADVAAGKIKGDKGDPGTNAREPEFTASVTAVEHDQPAAVSRSGAYPDVDLAFTLPRGRPGRDGDPGQPGSPGVDAREPVFTATATALGEDAQPTVGLSGTYPSLNLTFGIPRGKPGPVGPPGTGGTGGGGSHPLLLSGPGRPDVPTTTGGVITGSEAVGAEYRSTDGAGVGAWVWRKRPTGWVVVDGDTGWRNLLSEYQGPLILTPAPGGYGALVRRTTQGIHFNVDVAVAAPPSPPPGWQRHLDDVSHLFGQGTLFEYALAMNWQITSARSGSDGVIHWANRGYIRSWAGQRIILHEFTWCAGPWPSKLPGTPPPSPFA